jgi:hypothetical protein
MKKLFTLAASAFLWISGIAFASDLPSALQVEELIKAQASKAYAKRSTKVLSESIKMHQGNFSKGNECLVFANVEIGEDSPNGFLILLRKSDENWEATKWWMTSVSEFSMKDVNADGKTDLLVTSRFKEEGGSRSLLNLITIKDYNTSVMLNTTYYDFTSTASNSSVGTYIIEKVNLEFSDNNGDGIMEIKEVREKGSLGGFDENNHPRIRWGKMSVDYVFANGVYLKK